MNGTLQWLSKITFILVMIERLQQVSFKDNKILLDKSNILLININKALDIQKGQVQSKALQKLYKKLEIFENNSNIGINQEITTLFSFILVLVDDLKQYMKDKRKYNTLFNIEYKIMDLISYKDIDPELDKYQCYNKAVNFFKLWNTYIK
jgi:ribosomal protein S15P/S13E